MLLLLGSLLYPEQPPPGPPPGPTITASNLPSGRIKTRRRISTQPLWLPDVKTDDEDALLLILGVI